MSALHGLVCAGKVRYLAASSMWAFQLAQLQHTAASNGWHGMDEILSAREFQLSGEEDASMSQLYLPKAMQGHC